jgi:D-beta-D-heptose 7-phosphate kinase/D-beta-D-heptose 1-phosphate adenosyltransferase
MGELVTRDTLATLVQVRRQQGARAVLTNGCFDLLHLGHVTYLQQAQTLGDFLIVGLNSDASTRRLKGSARPLTPQDERAALLVALAAVDYVTIFDEDTAEALVAALQPAVYVKGADYAAVGSGDAYHLPAEELRRVLAGEVERFPALAGLAVRLPEAPVVAAYGGELALLPYLPGHSTTELIQRIVSRYAQTATAPQGASRPPARGE